MQQNPYRFSLMPRLIVVIKESGQRTATAKPLSFYMCLELFIIWHRQALSTPAKHCVQLKIVYATPELDAPMQQNPYRFSLKPRLSGAIQETGQQTAIPNPLIVLHFSEAFHYLAPAGPFPRSQNTACNLRLYVRSKN